MHKRESDRKYKTLIGIHFLGLSTFKISPLHIADSSFKLRAYQVYIEQTLTCSYHVSHSSTAGRAYSGENENVIYGE